MAFANLFTSLSAVEGGFGSPALTHRIDSEDGRRGRKRNAAGEQHHFEKPPHHPQPVRLNRNAYKVTNEAGHNNNWHHQGQNNQTRHKQQRQNNKKKKLGWKNNQRRQNGREGRCSKDGKKEAKPRFMTPEFIKQNALMVDGRLVCRHFMWSRCLKGDDCQLEHFQGCNDLIKDICKFYLQGFCSKGDACPYMHKSFPCKFFHRRGRCRQGSGCKFSHEPLNELTGRLLEEALKREEEQNELLRKAEAKSSGTPAKESEESEVTEPHRTPDVLLQPLRPNFYNSAETHTEKETSAQTDVPDETIPDVPPPLAPPLPPPPPPRHSAPPTGDKVPGCYSVEAVLRSPLSRRFPAFFSTGPSVGAPQASASRGGAPRSADAVLWSAHVENTTPGRTAAAKSSAAEPVCYSVEAVLGAPLCRPFGGLFTPLRTPGGSAPSSALGPAPSVDAAATKQTEASYSVDSVLKSHKVLQSTTSSQTSSTESNRVEAEAHLGGAGLGPRLATPFTSLFHTLAGRKSASPSPGAAPPSVQPSGAPSSVDAVLRCDKAVEPSTFGWSPPVRSVRYHPEVDPPSSRLKRDELPARNAAMERRDKVLRSLPAPHQLKPESQTNGEVERSPSCTDVPQPPDVESHTAAEELLPLSSFRFGSRASEKPFCPPSGGAAAGMEPAAGSTRSARHHLPLKQLFEVLQRSRKPRPPTKCDPQQSSTSRTSAESNCDAAAGLKSSPFHGLISGLVPESPTPASSSSSSSSKTAAGHDPDGSWSRSFLGLFAAPPHDPPAPSDSGGATKLRTQHGSKPPETWTGPEEDLSEGLSPDQLTNHKRAPQRPDEVQCQSSTTQEEKEEEESSCRGSVLRTLFVSLSPFQDAERRGDAGTSAEKETRDPIVTRRTSAQQERRRRCRARHRKRVKARQLQLLAPSAEAPPPLRPPGASDPEDMKQSGTRLLSTPPPQSRTLAGSDGKTSSLMDLFKTFDSTALQ